MNWLHIIYLKHDKNKYLAYDYSNDSFDNVQSQLDKIINNEKLKGFTFHMLYANGPKFEDVIKIDSRFAEFTQISYHDFFK